MVQTIKNWFRKLREFFEQVEFQENWEGEERFWNFVFDPEGNYI